MIAFAVLVQFCVVFRYTLGGVLSVCSSSWILVLGCLFFFYLESAVFVLGMNFVDFFNVSVSSFFAAIRFGDELDIHIVCLGCSRG